VAKINDVLNAVNLLMWDQNVMMPGSPGAASAHAAQTATLKGMAQQLLLSPETTAALAEAESAVASLDEDDPRRRSVAAVREAVDFHARISPELLAERSTAAGACGERLCCAIWMLDTKNV
jgi:carboxypeptidase Taq